MMWSVCRLHRLQGLSPLAAAQLAVPSQQEQAVSMLSVHCLQNYLLFLPSLTDKLTGCSALQCFD